MPALLSAAPASAFDFKISDTAWGLIDNDWYGSYAFGRADDKGFFGRGLTTGTFNYRLSNDTTIGASGSVEYFSNLDVNVDNIGDKPEVGVYTAVVYATGVWGDILYGKSYGATTELMDVAPSAIGFNFSVNSPFFIHTERPRLAPRSPTASLDFHQPSERYGFYSADYDGFRLGVTYAGKIHDTADPAFNFVQSKHALDVVLVWSGTLGNVRLRTTGAYQQAEADIVPANISTAADQDHWAIGGTMWWNGWCLGGNYAFAENTLGLKNVDNESYQFGAMYTYGKWSVSASHGTSTDLYDHDLTANPFLGALGICGTILI
jgi:hypothetical protein